MSFEGWIPGGVKLRPNISQRFESRWSQVKIIENHSVFLRGLKVSIWHLQCSWRRKDRGRGRIG